MSASLRRVECQINGEAPRSNVTVNSVEMAVLFGALAVLIFDAAGSFASIRFGFTYPRLAPGSFLIYALVGMAAGRTGSLDAAVASGAAVAFVEATLGWAISSRIRRAYPHLAASRLLLIIVMVTTMGGFFGGVGGVVAHALPTRAVIALPPSPFRAA
jgi:hypothetical protein